MLSSLFRLLCCCCSRKPEPNVVDERERLLQFQIPTMPSQPIQAQESDYRQRMGTIVRNMKGKMVNVSSRLPFNLHNRVIRDSIGSRSRSQSLGYDAPDRHNYDDDDSYHSLLRRHSSSQKQPYEHRYPVYYQSSQSRSPSIGLGSASIDHEVDKPAAILSLRLVGASEIERGRARERTVKPTGLSGGVTVSSTQPVDVKASDPSISSPQFEFKFIDPVLSSWSDPVSYHPVAQS